MRFDLNKLYLPLAALLNDQNFIKNLVKPKKSMLRLYANVENSSFMKYRLAINISINDLYRAYRYRSLIFTLGWLDILQRYRRSSIGPFWLTLTMSTMTIAMGFVFSRVLKVEVNNLLPFLAVGLILWTLISGVISESAVAFTGSEAIIKELDIPLSCHIFRIIYRNMIVLFHNVIILPFLFIWAGITLDAGVDKVYCFLLGIGGILFLIINLTWMGLLSAVVCTRYRDIPPIISNSLQFIFYITPIVWMPKTLKGTSDYLILDLNPFYHLVEIVREPILGHRVDLTSWLYVLLFSLIGWAFSLLIYGYYKQRIAYWL
jgi:ABC-type polysaccharide/polyol phosphate export permease